MQFSDPELNTSTVMNPRLWPASKQSVTNWLESRCARPSRFSSIVTAPRCSRYVLLPVELIQVYICELIYPSSPGASLGHHKTRGSRPGPGTEAPWVDSSAVSADRGTERRGWGVLLPTIWMGLETGEAMSPSPNIFRFLRSKMRVLVHPRCYFLQMINLNWLELLS